jgi:hypothetical protein
MYVVCILLYWPKSDISLAILKVRLNKVTQILYITIYISYTNSDLSRIEGDTYIRSLSIHSYKIILHSEWLNDLSPLF